MNGNKALETPGERQETSGFQSSEEGTCKSGFLSTQEKGRTH